MLRLSGASLDSLATKFEISRDAIWRHMSRHVSDDVKAGYLGSVNFKNLAEKAATEGKSLIEYYSIVRSMLMQQFVVVSAGAQDRYASVAIARALSEVLRDMGRITGEMSTVATKHITNNSVTFINSPMFADLQRMLIEKLSSYPEALSAVVDGLRELEARNTEKPASEPRKASQPVLELEAIDAAA